MNRFDLADFKKVKARAIKKSEESKWIMEEGIVNYCKYDFKELKEKRDKKYENYKYVKKMLTEMNMFSPEKFQRVLKKGLQRSYELKFYKTDEQVTRISESESFFSCGSYQIYGMFDKEDKENYYIGDKIKEFFLDRPWLKERGKYRDDDNVILINVGNGRDAALLAETIEMIAKLQYDVEVKATYYYGKERRAYYYNPSKWVK